MPASDFWVQTPRLADIIVEAKARGDQAARGWLAWHIAYLPLMKTPASLADLTGIRPQTKKMTPDAMRAVFASMREAA